jgi:hypothetical protein
VTWLLRKLRAVKAWLGVGAPDLELVVFKHVQAEPHTLLSFELGSRCIYCFAHPRSEKWRRPCTRMRPSMTELA